MEQQMGLKKQDDQIGQKESKGNEIAGVRRGTSPPLNFIAILKDHDQNLGACSPEEICHRLYAGVYLKPNTLKYFVDKKSNKNCFVIFARELSVCHGDNPECWRWIPHKETSGEDIEVAELLMVWWLDIKYSFRTINLSPGTLYEIVFIVKRAYASEFSMDLSINQQHLKSLTRSESLEGKPLGNWFEIQVGEFMMSPQYVGNMEFWLHQSQATPKSGLVVKCAVIRPKK